MIGSPIPRREDARLLTGRGQFADDLRHDGQVYAAFVRSPHAHAVIEAIRVDPARAMPRVLGVFTGPDLRDDGVGPIPALLAERSGGTRNRDGSIIREPVWWAIAIDRVRHVGEPVAFVIATTPDAARDAADLVEVDYHVLPAVVDAVDALRPDAPQLFDDRPRNVVIDWSTGHEAAVASAFASAAHVERTELFAQRLSPAYLEPRSALASHDAASGRFTLEVCAQAVHALAASLAYGFGVPVASVRCVSRDVGGAFGGKNYPYPEYVACLWAARRLGRPVKWTSSRTEGFVSDSHARDNRIAGEMAFDASGRILGLRVHVHANEGAYIGGGIPFSISLNMERMISGLYVIPAIDLIVQGTVTNTVPVQVYRGVGRTEAVMIVERLVDGAARALGRDVAAMRRQNMVTGFRTTRRAVPSTTRATTLRVSIVCSPWPTGTDFLRGAKRPGRADDSGASASARTSRAPAGRHRSSPRCACFRRASSRCRWVRTARARGTRPRSHRWSPIAWAFRTSRCASSSATPTAWRVEWARLRHARW